MPNDVGYWEKLRRFWFEDLNSLWWLLMGLPALYFFQTLMHEGAHALTNLFKTGDFPKLAPYPHISPTAGFRNGVTFQAEGFVATPQFLALTVIVVLTLIFLFWPLRNRTARFLLRTWYLIASIDLLYNISRELIGGHNRFADWSRFQDDYSLATGVMVFLSLLFWLIVLSHFLWVYWAAFANEAPDCRNFWDFRWLAMVFGILSFCALLFAAIVGDNSIDKGSAIFIIYVIMQVLAFVWYWLYFGLTFRYSAT